MSTAAPPEQKPTTRPQPVLKVTRYDQVSSTLVCSVIALGFLFCALTAVWITNRLTDPESDVALELLEMSGGSEDGAIDETLKLESPEDVIDDPSLADVQSDEIEIEQMLENVVELADQATNQTTQTFDIAVSNTGNPGSATGTGRRALGIGPGEGGLPREQRWFVRFSNRGSLGDYARQLDHFGIELGALVGGKEIVYLSDVSSGNPKTRRAGSGRGEKRLYMTWQGGTRKRGDLELYKKVGVDVGAGTIFHFYPKQTEQMLARLERDYRNKSVKEIRRTYFLVRGSRKSYQFVVARQVYFQ